MIILRIKCVKRHSRKYWKTRYFRHINLRDRRRHFYKNVLSVPLAENRILMLAMMCDLVRNKRFRQHPFHNHKPAHSLRLFDAARNSPSMASRSLMFTRGCHWFVLPENSIFIYPSTFRLQYFSCRPCMLHKVPT
jgi:hypothetical protein